MSDLEIEKFSEENTSVEAHSEPGNVKAILTVPMNVQVVLGTTKIHISQLMQLTRGSVLELEKKVGEPVDVMINDRIVARGDLVKINGDRLGVTLTEIRKVHTSEV